ncbi:tetratricopeptide repeat protein [Aurantibacter crassamenti]|uniref:tetratricopeptide repeat protein n=1 Tax=Aurantibacter crassamenti TaxID=1837375 RepID=UPI001939A93B|nr:tetratricopeptide repeat protein [Aurantibacter crassamenti]MBM1105651.1 tetratricopeptide repeat protein [Aurantibacter crassamenti]
MRKLVLILFFISYCQTKAQTTAIADSLYATGNYAKAINKYAEEGSVKGALQIARAYNAIGNSEKAITQYRSVVEKNPDFQIASFELGKLLVKTKDYDAARKRFAKLVSETKDNPEYYFYLGEIYAEIDQPASSIIAYKNAIKNDSTHLRSLFKLAKYFVIKNDKNQALHYIEKGLNFYPDDVSLINLKALTHFNDNAYEEAIPFFERVLALGETKEYVYDKLAYCYYKNWEFEKARANYKKMLEIDDGNSDTYFKLAEAYRKDKVLDSAEIYINEAMNIQKPVFAQGYSSLGSMAREREDFKTALDFYKRAHAEDPSDPHLYHNICTLVDRNYKDLNLKLEYYEKYLEKYGKLRDRQALYYTTMVSKRISQLKEEIHLNAE